MGTQKLKTPFTKSLTQRKSFWNGKEASREKNEGTRFGGKDVLCSWLKLLYKERTRVCVVFEGRCCRMKRMVSHKEELKKKGGGLGSVSTQECTQEGSWWQLDGGPPRGCTEVGPRQKPCPPRVGRPGACPGADSHRPASWCSGLPWVQRKGTETQKFALG